MIETPDNPHPYLVVMSEIAIERSRQMSEEGWTPEHDDAHRDGELALAGACYARMPYWRAISRKPVGHVTAPSAWPWDHKWWKPKDDRRDLIRAAALIIAEIERLDRAEICTDCGGTGISYQSERTCACRP